MSVEKVYDAGSFGAEFSISKVTGVYYLLKIDGLKFKKPSASYAGIPITMGIIKPIPQIPASTRIYPIVNEFGTVVGSVKLTGGGEIIVCFPAEAFKNTTQSIDVEILYTGSLP